jgi:hypothetical protein
VDDAAASEQADTDDVERRGRALHFEITRGAPLFDGVRFDVQWRLEGSDGSVLQSDCLTVTVK